MGSIFKTVLNKIKNFYIWFFSKVIQAWKAIVFFNKLLIGIIKDDFRANKYIRGSLKSVLYVLFFIVQVLLGALVIASYIMCKLTGICLII